MGQWRECDDIRSLIGVEFLGKSWEILSEGFACGVWLFCFTMLLNIQRLSYSYYFSFFNKVSPLSMSMAC